MEVVKRVQAAGEKIRAAAIDQARIRERNEIYAPAGKARTSFIDARDIGTVVALALTEEGHTGKSYDRE